ncbi:ORF6C domain-containing protein [Metasolibacillus fluoroglycofenilyticus]|uniref:ORF6C domain-containing protein n=1 Tax=Metasolibacillus fluoroglycofenilyticus TaxID=1239396 RepID=UPI00137A7AB8|nr:ORF6C domain-containing protein [Metasolibacillus fluoroglycofenilyticus]
MRYQFSQDHLQEGERIRLRNAVAERVYALSNSSGAQPILFKALYTALKERYAVNFYGDIKRNQMQDALRFIAQWRG